MIRDRRCMFSVSVFCSFIEFCRRKIEDHLSDTTFSLTLMSTKVERYSCSGLISFENSCTIGKHLWMNSVRKFTRCSDFQLNFQIQFYSGGK